MNQILPRVYADFHNADPVGRLRLTCVGTTEDLDRLKIQLSEGMRLTFYADDVNAQGNTDELIVDGIVGYSRDENCWVATIDWDAIRHASSDSPTSVVKSAS
jgi:hypothetical protein